MKQYFKNLYIYSALIATTLAVVLTACEKVEVVTNLDRSYIEFKNEASTLGYAQLKKHTFFKQNESITADTIWLPMNITGLIPDKDSRISLEAFQEETMPANTVPAVAGLHYVPFDDPSIAEYMLIKAGQKSTTIPIVLLRSADLKEHAAQLSIKVASSKDLYPGVLQNTKARITTADHRQRPTNWPILEVSLLGMYGKVKHDFLVRATGKEFDEAFISLLEVDAGLLAYYKIRLKELLVEENAERVRQGLPILMEDPQDETTKVTFP